MAADPDDLALALELADTADEITAERFGASDLVVETKPDLTPVSEADTAVERLLRERLAEARPGDGVLGEEYGDSTFAGGERRWIVDPIDGTKNFVRQIPVWATLIALEEQGQITVGVVSAPALHRRWWAIEGGGAFVEDGLPPLARPIHVSKVSELADAQLSFGDFELWGEVGRQEPLLNLARSCWRSRGFGDFWSYMLVAEGAVDIGLDVTAALWDLAAPKVIVEQAGGRFSDGRGERTADGGDGVASNGLLHEAVLSILGR